MGAKLWTWVGSTRVWVAVGCLVYLGLVRGQGPRLAAVWPWGPWVAQGLMLLALFYLGWIVSDALARYILGPFFTFLEGKKPNERTAKAKEKLADSLMSFSTSVFSAIVISILVFPLTAFIQAMARGTDPVAVLVSWWQPERWSWWDTGVFLVLYWLPFSVSLLFRRRALDLYDELPQPAPAVAPIALGTNEQPRIPAEVQTTHTSANGGSRRRRRPRAK